MGPKILDASRNNEDLNNNNNKKPHLISQRSEGTRSLKFGTTIISSVQNIPRDICPCNNCPGDTEKFLVKRKFVPTIVRPEKNFGPKRIFGPKKNIGPKNPRKRTFGPKIFFGPKKTFGS